jgi:acetyltransferase-like isoleucine patch superfamily enzyme
MPVSSEFEQSRMVRAVHGLQETTPDPAFELEFSDQLREQYDQRALIEIFRRHSIPNDYLNVMMRRVCVRTMTRRCGHGLRVAHGVTFRHPETFEIGNGVFIGEQTILQGRYDGRCVIGDGVWIGPQSFLDARDLVLGNHVGWGPGAKVLGSVHTGIPTNIPIIATDLEIEPVRVDDWADIGVNAILLPGISVGKGAIVGAGAVVSKDVPPFAKVAGVPAVVIGWRDDRSVPDINR